MVLENSSFFVFISREGGDVSRRSFRRWRKRRGTEGAKVAGWRNQVTDPFSPRFKAICRLTCQLAEFTFLIDRLNSRSREAACKGNQLHKQAARERNAGPRATRRAKTAGTSPPFHFPPPEGVVSCRVGNGGDRVNRDFRIRELLESDGRLAREIFRTACCRASNIEQRSHSLSLPLSFCLPSISQNGSSRDHRWSRRSLKNVQRRT